MQKYSFQFQQCESLQRSVLDFSVCCTDQLCNMNDTTNNVAAPGQYIFKVDLDRKLCIELYDINSKHSGKRPCEIPRSKASQNVR